MNNMLKPEANQREQYKDREDVLYILKFLGNLPGLVAISSIPLASKQKTTGSPNNGTSVSKSPSSLSPAMSPVMSRVVSPAMSAACPVMSAAVPRRPLRYSKLLLP